jgi:hypothetical protein
MFSITQPSVARYELGLLAVIPAALHGESSSWIDQYRSLLRALEERGEEKLA